MGPGEFGGSAALVVFLFGHFVTVVFSIKDCYTRVDGRIVYEGINNVADFGQACQAWSSQDGRTHNYCRAPRAGDLQPWCFVRADTGNLIQARCDVEHCTECYTVTGSDYRGTQSKPSSNESSTEECVSWTDESGGKRFNTKAHPDDRSGLGDHNYCRNPWPEGRPSPWCYTGKTPASHKQCLIPNCKVPGYLGCVTETETAPLLWNVVRTAYFSQLTIAHCVTYCRDHGTQYAGFRNGNQCICIAGPRDVFRSLPEVTDCNKKCAGDSRHFCGGTNSTALFDTRMGQCGGWRYGVYGTIHSPNFPSDYPNGEICSWSIMGPENHVLRLHFAMYDIADSEDYVAVWDNSTRRRVLLTPSKNGYVVDSNHAGLHFVADSAKNGPGFSLVFEAVKKCPKPDILNGKADADSFLPGQFATVECDPGFRVFGPAKVMCEDDGTFKNLPECLSENSTLPTPVSFSNNKTTDASIVSTTSHHLSTDSSQVSTTSTRDQGTTEVPQTTVKRPRPRTQEPAKTSTFIATTTESIRTSSTRSTTSRPFSTKERHHTTELRTTQSAEHSKPDSSSGSSQEAEDATSTVVIGVVVAIVLILVIGLLIYTSCAVLAAKRARQASLENGQAENGDAEVNVPLKDFGEESNTNDEDDVQTGKDAVLGEL
uniref:Kringle-containing protein marking the eye and the nose n=1 Tax=Branchiostoma belcheri TaxID=7741 RepID=E5FPT2_BRABE|nr:kringle-containing transmembrane protein 1 [Branchiostoma belcheri]